MKFIHFITLFLVILGGLNWGLIGLVDLNLVTTLFGTGVLTTLVYIMVTVSTFYHVFPIMMKQVHTA